MCRSSCPDASDSYGYTSPRCVPPCRNLHNKQRWADGKVPCDKTIKILVMRVAILEKEWVAKMGLGSGLEESQEGELKLEMVMGNDKPYKVYIVQPFCKQ